MRSSLGVWVATVLVASAPASAIASGGPGATIGGTVTLTAADGRTSAGDGARVMLACGVDGMTRTAVADDHGAFSFQDVPADRCSIEADVQGFRAPPVIVVMAAQQVAGIELQLGVVPLRAGVTVGGTTPSLAPAPLSGSCRSDTRRPSAKRCRR